MYNLGYKENIYICVCVGARVRVHVSNNSMINHIVWVSAES